jgi:hypothetical protein
VDPITWLEDTLGRRRDRTGVLASFDDRGYVCRWRGGAVDAIAWSELLAVEIRTTDQGPVRDDVFLVLRSAHGDCTISQSDETSDLLLERVQKLPGFDSEAVLAAMACIENATFVCWEAPEGRRPAQKPLS